MEIIYQKVSGCGFSNLSFQIKEGIILGITGDYKEDFLRMLSGKNSLEGEITYKNTLYENSYELSRKIGLVEKQFKNIFSLKIVEEYLSFIIYENNLKLKDAKKKIISAFKMVGLSSDYLQKDMATLSTSEKKLLQIAICLLSNPEVILLEEPFIDLDIHTQNRLIRLFVKLKERYKKTIIIASENSNLLYQVTDEMFFLKNKAIFRKGKTGECYQNVSQLLRYHYEIPNIVLFTYLVEKEKNRKLSYHKDIRDLIKDIYKHV